MSDVDKNGIPLEIVRAAMKEPALRGRVLLGSLRREALRCDGQIVGFVTPRNQRDSKVLGGIWRHGPIYILPEFRGRGLLVAYYDAHPRRVCVSFVAHDNEESLRAHLAAGFVAWRRHRAGVFLRREAKP